MTTHQLVMLVWSLVGLSVFIYLFFQTAPYGRHQEKGWGFEIRIIQARIRIKGTK